MATPWRGIITEYRDFLPFAKSDPVVTLAEGGTPLVAAPALAALLNEYAGHNLKAQVWLKVEGANPSGSFKDRGMTTAVSKVVARGAQTVVCASTGNTSASAAAYAAQAGIGCAVILPHGKIAAGKLAQAVVHGAKLIAIAGNFDDCLQVARELAANYPVALVNSVNPDRLQGQKTAAFEICDVLGNAPDIHVLPVGNAGNISAYWMGYTEYLAAGRCQHRPRMWGVQASGAAPFVAGHPIAAPETIATAIRIGNPASWDLALKARDESGGTIFAVSDEEIRSAQAFLAREVGVFVEPASAAAAAGLISRAQTGKVPQGMRIVCTVTGNGLKDIDTAMADVKITPKVLAPVVAQVAADLDLIG